jgi:hypothetical protein
MGKKSQSLAKSHINEIFIYIKGSTLIKKGKIMIGSD